ncbi:unnamed protein product [Rotaria magnacalcarata]|uniref:Uncharacterized protein n=1 Tax=Rotaria magnacalcarata TaxID=392030 RepID=A0A820C389_9BILA|nr:unnamed protein product [Rotaria magnacalcarata]
MRTPSIIIERVAHWLEFFTLAELVFVLSEDARMYPLDKFPIEKIALAVRHTFSSEQSNNDVKMLIEDLSMSYCQTRPLVKPTSISFIKIRHNNHLLVPFRSSCPTCYQSLNINNSCQKCIRLYCHNGSVVLDNLLNATSCRTLKARSDEYTKACTRSFGLIAIVTNCRIITSFSELYRLETLKEIINLFAVTIRVAGKLAPTVVYDDGCHLVKYVKNHIGRDLAKTSAMELLASTPISVDRSHFRNHVGDFSRQNMNPDKNPLLNDVKRQAAEQTFSWLKQYANIMSNMGYRHAPLFILTLFNLKNLSTMKKSPSSAYVCPEFDLVSLCHLERTQRASTTTEDTSLHVESTTTCTSYVQNNDMPKGTTDLDAKLFSILNRKNTL